MKKSMMLFIFIANMEQEKNDQESPFCMAPKKLK